jgi:hypothetical protein
MTETSEAAACVGIEEDIAALARKFAKKDPYKSASGPEALLALATHLDAMVARVRAGQTRVIRVAVRKKRSVGNDESAFQARRFGRRSPSTVLTGRNLRSRKQNPRTQGDIGGPTDPVLLFLLS